MKGPIITDNSVITVDNNEASKLLLKENNELKEKVKKLEEQCKEFERKVIFLFLNVTTFSFQNYLSKNLFVTC